MLSYRRRIVWIVVLGVLAWLALPGVVWAHEGPEREAPAPAGGSGETEDPIDESEDSATLGETFRAMRPCELAARCGPIHAEGSGFVLTVFRPPIAV